MLIEMVIDDGGRASAGYKGPASDCVARAIAIASGSPYPVVYDEINVLGQSERKGKNKKGTSNARTGVYRTAKLRAHLLTRYGAVWVPTMAIGSGCKVHLRASELPAGRLVVALSKHCAAVIDGVLHDTHDCSREGTRCVYGYWVFPDLR
jgi:hypothetical protein